MQDKNQKEKTEYISLLEAAKKSGYAQDYLSLLCRQGKLRGEKIGRNWVTTYQWLDTYQQNLISDVYTGTKKSLEASDASELGGIGYLRRIRKTFKEKERRIKIPKLVLAASLFFLILLGGFSYAKNPQFFSGIAPLEIMSRSLSQLNNNVKKISVSEINLKPKFLTGLAQQAYQIKNQIAYRMSDVKDNIPQTPSVGNLRHSVSVVVEKISDNTSENIYSRIDAGKSIAVFPLQAGEKFGEAIVNVPMGIGDGIERGFAKSDLVLNSSFKKAGDNIYCRFQDNFKTADEEKEFGQVAGVNTSVELQELNSRMLSESSTLGTLGSLLELFGSFKNNIQLALSDVKDAFERGIILCRTTLTIQRDDKKFDEKTSDKFTEQNQILEAVQISLKELSEGENDQTRDALIVLPSPKSEEEREKLKEKIELSFSDEVEIKPEDAASGIITPVFRKTKGDDYLYLMVPVRE